MTGERFKSIVSEAFVPFLKELGFVQQPIHLSGKYHRASFVGHGYTLIISIEPAEYEMTVMLVTNGDDDLASIDDPARTPRLSDLNRKYMPGVTSRERDINDQYFSSIQVEGKNELALLKTAKELRLVLGKHIDGTVGK